MLTWEAEEEAQWAEHYALHAKDMGLIPNNVWFWTTQAAPSKHQKRNNPGTSPSVASKQTKMLI